MDIVTNPVAEAALSESPAIMMTIPAPLLGVLAALVISGLICIYREIRLEAQSKS